MAALQSSSWSGASEYSEESEYRSRATSFLATISWDLVAEHCAQLRNNQSRATLSAEYSIGHFNLVRRVSFDDGVHWIIRFQLPPLAASEAPGISQSTLRSGENIINAEVAGMRFLRSKLVVPVPEVHDYNSSLTNKFNARYIIMDYIDGIPADAMKERMKCEVGLYGTPAQDTRFREQMAVIQAQLASYAFSKIGTLFCDGQTDFVIGPDVETGLGPWDSSLDYFNDIADHSFQAFLASITDDTKLQWHRSCSLPLVFKQLAKIYCTRISGPFPVMNRDFGAHNLLVNVDFEIVGVIDCDSLIAAPIEMAAQFPRFTGLDRPIPLSLKEKPEAVLEREKRTAPQLEHYAQLLANAEQFLNSIGKNSRPATVNFSRMFDDFLGLQSTFVTDNDRIYQDLAEQQSTSVTLSNYMFSDAASIVQGLEEYGSPDLNNRWMDYYLILLRRKYQSAKDESVKSGEP